MGDAGTHEPVRIRPAHSSETETLTALALRSKAHWGYDNAFMSRAAPVLTVTGEMIADGRVFVVEAGEEAVGLYALSYDDDAAELELLFVEPAHLGAGHGERLFAHACQTARKSGARRLVVESDPNALGFYERMGMVRSGARMSPVDPARELPLLTLDLG